MTPGGPVDRLALLAIEFGDLIVATALVGAALALRMALFVRRWRDVERYLLTGVGFAALGFFALLAKQRGTDVTGANGWLVALSDGAMIVLLLLAAALSLAAVLVMVLRGEAGEE